MKVNRTTALALVIGAAAVGVGGGVAYATIPDSGGVIHGCYLHKIGVLRLDVDLLAAKMNKARAKARKQAAATTPRVRRPTTPAPLGALPAKTLKKTARPATAGRITITEAAHLLEMNEPAVWQRVQASCGW